MDSWQPIETAPMDGTRVLHYLPADDRFGVGPAMVVRDPSDEEGQVRKATHWMHLPKAPS